MLPSATKQKEKLLVKRDSIDTEKNIKCDVVTLEMGYMDSNKTDLQAKESI